MLVAIIDYGAGNLQSATNAFRRTSYDSGIRADICLTNSAEIISNADRVVLPGVGAFSECHAGIKAISGMEDAIREAVLIKARPFLGICVGAQLMATRSLEKKNTAGFNWINGDVVFMSPNNKSLKIPHTGWNTIKSLQMHPVLNDIPTGDNGLHAYFIHSYHIKAKHPSDIIAVTDYGGQVAAIVGRDNMIGTQFHPEKSQSLGLKLISNFLSWRP